MAVREYPSGRRAIRLQFEFKGVTCRETLKGLEPTAANVKYAENLKAEIEVKITQGKFRYSEYFPQSKRGRMLDGGPSYANLKDLEKAYKAEIRRKYQPATVRSYLQPLDYWVLPELGMVPLAELTAGMIRRKVRELAQRGLKTKSVSNYKTALNRILDYAVDEEYIEVNPALAVSVARTIGRQENKAENVDPFTQEEVKTILSTASDHSGARFARYLTFAFYSGLRTSELYALRWEDVDLKAQTVHVCRAVVQGKLKNQPKTDAGIRDVLLLPPALEALREQQKETRFSRHGFVWENPKTRKPLRRYKETAGRWRRVLAKAKVRYRNPYQTRHTYASHLLSGGENAYFVARQLGHKTVEVVMRHYGRWIEQVNRIDGHRWVSDYGREK